MLLRIKEFFSSGRILVIEPGGEISKEDLALSSAALLLLMAGVDSEVVEEEIEAIFSTLESTLNISQEQAEELLQAAHSSCLTAEHINEFTSVLSANLSIDQKITVLAMVWVVVIADGRIHHFEAEFAEYLRGQLGLNESQAADARKLAAMGSV